MRCADTKVFSGGKNRMKMTKKSDYSYINTDPASQKARQVYDKLIQSSATVPGKELHRDCVIIVEDDTAMRRLLCRTISQLAPRVDVLSAANGAEGLAAVAEVRQRRAKDPILIIADLIMPKLDGWAFVEALQRNQQQSKAAPIPLIVFSGSSGRKGVIFKKDIHKMKASYGPLITVAKHDSSTAAMYDGSGIDSLTQFAGMMLKRVI